MSSDRAGVRRLELRDVRPAGLVEADHQRGAALEAVMGELAALPRPVVVDVLARLEASVDALGEPPTPGCAGGPGPHAGPDRDR